MSEISFRIRSWAGWSEGMPEPALESPLLLRRRVTSVGKIALGLAWSLPGSDQTRYIFSSRHGEFERTLSLLQASSHGEDPSPADFTLSVHHALIGLLSITQNNKRGHSAVASGADSFCFALIEAAVCLRENPHEPILLIHCDDYLPTPYNTFAEKSDKPVALALLLTAEQNEGFSVTQSSKQQQNSETRNLAVDFLDFLQKDTTSYQSQSFDRCWHWTRHASP